VFCAMPTHCIAGAILAHSSVLANELNPLFVLQLMA